MARRRLPLTCFVPFIGTMHSAAVFANRKQGQGCHNVTCVRIVHREEKEHWTVQIASKLIQAKIVVA